MKRFGLFLFAFVLVAGVSGCGGGGDDDSPVGYWRVLTDYSCNGGTIYTDYWRIYSDGTFDYGGTGDWEIDGNEITLTSGSGILTWSGIINGDQMEGTFEKPPNIDSSYWGCWTAERLSTDPA